MVPNNKALLEQKLQESEQRFRPIADTAPVLIWISGTDKLCTHYPFLPRTTERSVHWLAAQGLGRADS